MKKDENIVADINDNDAISIIAAESIDKALYTYKANVKSKRQYEIAIAVCRKAEMIIKKGSVHTVQQALLNACDQLLYLFPEFTPEEYSKHNNISSFELEDICFNKILLLSAMDITVSSHQLTSLSNYSPYRPFYVSLSNIESYRMMWTDITYNNTNTNYSIADITVSSDTEGVSQIKYKPNKEQMMFFLKSLCEYYEDIYNIINV